MEAKDVKWCPQHGYPEPCDKCGWQSNPPQSREELIEQFRKYHVIKLHSRAYGNMYRIEIPVEDYEKLFGGGE